MQMMTTPQRPLYKGNMHLRVRPHVGVIAFGNALGNAIVGKMRQIEIEKLNDDLSAQGKLITQNLDKNNRKATDREIEALSNKLSDKVAKDVQQQQAKNLTPPHSTQSSSFSSGNTQRWANEFMGNNPLFNFELKQSLSEFSYASQNDSKPSFNLIPNGYQLETYFSETNRLKHIKFDPNGFCASPLVQQHKITSEQVKQTSLGMITAYNPDERIALPEYDPNYELTGGAMLMPTSAQNQIYQNALLDRQKAFFAPTRWDQQVAQGINDLGMIMATFSNPELMATAYTSYQAIDLAGSAYQHREQLGAIWNEAKQNGGATFAIGATGGLQGGNAEAAGALGFWLSVDFNTWDFNGGVYRSTEGGGRFGLSNLAWSAGIENTVFTTSDFVGALKGGYTLQGAGYNQYEFSRIQAATGTINGYQFTKEFRGNSVVKLIHDPYAYSRSGIGGFYTLEELKEKLYGH